MLADGINESYIGTLIKTNNHNHVGIGKIPIDRTHDELYDTLIRRINIAIENNYQESSEIYNSLQVLNKSSALFTIESTYCEDLCSPYQFHLFLFNFELVEKNTELSELDKLKALQRIVNYYKQALPFDRAYEITKSNRNIVAHTHRQIGWKQPVYHFDDKLSIEFATNFGFGYSSYFLLKLEYRTIPIVPYSHLIEYRICEAYEIRRYTRKYNVSNSSWAEILEFTKNACNLYIDDESAFVNKHIITEVEKMVSGIEEILMQITFKLIDQQTNNCEYYTFEHHKLIDFRCEKVSGAITFINDLRNLNDLMDVDRYIYRIEQCSLMLIPTVKEQLVLAQKELNVLNDQIKNIEPDYLNKKEQFDHLSNVPNEIGKLFENLNEPRSSNFIRNLDEILKDYFIFRDSYEKAESEYSTISGTYNQLKLQANDLEVYIDHFMKYLEMAEHYFTNTSTN